jgi:hypothetical protein
VPQFKAQCVFPPKWKSEYNPLETELDDGSNDSVGHQNTKLSTAQKKHNSCVKKGDSEFQRQHHGDWVDEESDDGSDDNFHHQNKRSTAPGADREVSLISRGTTMVIGGMMNCNSNSMN